MTINFTSGSHNDLIALDKETNKCYIVTSSRMYQHPTSEVFLSVREDVSSNEAHHDLMLVCRDRDEGIVQTNKSLLGLYSPLLRRIFGDMTSNSDVDMVILPDLKKATVAEMLKILSFKWSEADCWGLDVVNLLRDLNVTIVFNSANDVSLKNDEQSESHHKIELSGTKENTVVSVEIAASDALNEEQKVPSDKEMNEFMTKASTKHEAKCPRCPRTFSGPKVKDLLKCHVGLIHFHNEVVSEIQTYFNNSNNCRDCGKVYTNQSSRKKHLVFNHTKYVQQVMTVVNQSLDGPAVSEEAEVPTMKKMFEFSCSFNNCVKHWESKDNTVSSLHYIKSHLLTHFSDKFSSYQKEYFKNKMCTKCNSLNTLYTNLYLQNRHLFEKHNILSEEIQETFEGIVKPQSHSQSIPSQDQKDSGNESVITMFEQQQVHRVGTAKAEDFLSDVIKKVDNPNGHSGESESGKVNRSEAASEVNDGGAQVDVDSVDSLLYSDNEDDGESNME